MEIRYLRPDDDLSAISNIYERSWKYAYKGMIPQDYLDSIPAGRWAGGITKAGLTNFVCLEDGMMVGTACICRSRWEAFSGYGEIVSIYFLPEYMGKGLGSHLLKRCISELMQLGFDRILLWVLEENARARRFYEKNGFVCSGTFREDTIGGETLREVMYCFHRGHA